jgi:putative endopeptidase
MNNNEELNYVYKLYDKYNINEEDFDNNINLSDNFNLYVNNKWQKKNPIPDKHISWGSFQVLNEETKQKLKKLVENEYNVNDLENINILYSTGMDEDKINNDDIKPLEKYLKELNEIKTKKDLFKYLSKLYKLGLTGIFGIGPSEDAKNSILNVPHLYGGGLGLPDRDYYFDDDKKEIRLKYFKYIKKLLFLLNYEEKKAHKITEDILKIETQIAYVTYTREERRDPEKRYNKMTLEELIKIAPNIEWELFFEGLTNIKITYLIVDNPKYFKTLSNMFENISLEIWKNLFTYKIVKSSASYLSERFINHNFSFYNKELSGQKEKKSRWERILSICNGCIGELIGKLYVKKYFPESSKNEMFDLVKKIMKVLKDRIKKSTWMSNDTKTEALLKHKALITKIGYPDKWKDYTNLNLSKKNSFLENIILCSKFDFEREIKKLYKETDPFEWGMDPQEINAYFHPLKNEIVFPAGILQFPFFCEDMHYAYNYGAIGAVIGHELTHCFDDQGSKYDHEGNLRNWWSKDSRVKFEKKTKYFEEEYNKFKVNGKNVNGKLTLGENLADHGGVKIAFYALVEKMEEENVKESNKKDIYKKFFLSWARVWRCNIRNQEAEKRLITDPHSPNEWRINGTLANITEFHKVFNIKEGDELFRENIPIIW